LLVWMESGCKWRVRGNSWNLLKGDSVTLSAWRDAARRRHIYRKGKKKPLKRKKKNDPSSFVMRRKVLSGGP